MVLNRGNILLHLHMNAAFLCCASRALQRAPGLYQPLGKKLFTRPSVLPNSMTSHRTNGSKAAMAKELHERLIWIDCEMTGLEIDKDHIIEIACLITDGELNLIAEGPNIIIHQSEEILDKMNDWCVEHHGKSGLTEEVRASKVSLQQAEYEMLSFVREHSAPGFCPLAGNSVHADKEFLTKYMPQLSKHLHYRIVDVSTVKELCRRWYPVDYKAAPSKQAAHRALDDIKESIKELKYYRKAIFK